MSTTAVSNPPRPALTRRQQQVRHFIYEFLCREGFPPTIREIGQQWEIGPNAVVGHLKALQQKGYLTWTPNRARSLRLLPPEAGADSQTPALTTNQLFADGHVLVGTEDGPACSEFIVMDALGRQRGLLQLFPAPDDDQPQVLTLF